MARLLAGAALVALLHFSAATSATNTTDATVPDALVATERHRRLIPYMTYYYSRDQFGQEPRHQQLSGATSYSTSNLLTNGGGGGSPFGGNTAVPTNSVAPFAVNAIPSSDHRLRYYPGNLNKYGRPVSNNLQGTPFRTNTNPAHVHPIKQAPLINYPASDLFSGVYPTNQVPYRITPSVRIPSNNFPFTQTSKYQHLIRGFPIDLTNQVPNRDYPIKLTNQVPHRDYPIKLTNQIPLRDYPSVKLTAPVPPISYPVQPTTYPSNPSSLYPLPPSYPTSQAPTRAYPAVAPTNETPPRDYSAVPDPSLDYEDALSHILELLRRPMTAAVPRPTPVQPPREEEEDYAYYDDGNDEDDDDDIPVTKGHVNKITPNKVGAGTRFYPGSKGGTPGRPGVDYPTLAKIPDTGFDCKSQRYKGFFGDPDTDCQVWHYCDLNGGQASFLCPNGTIFSQVGLTCDWWFNVRCDSTVQLYVLNERLYKYILPAKPSFPEDYSGPAVDRYLTEKFREKEEKRKQKEEEANAT